DLAAKRLLESIDAPVDLGDAEARVEAQREFDEHDPPRAPRPDPGEFAILAATWVPGASQHVGNLGTCADPQPTHTASTTDDGLRRFARQWRRLSSDRPARPISFRGRGPYRVDYAATWRNAASAPGSRRQGNPNLGSCGWSWRRPALACQARAPWRTADRGPLAECGHGAGEISI